jgi:hypothetical protein
MPRDDMTLPDDIQAILSNDSHVGELLKTLHIEDAPPETQATIISDIGGVLLGRLTLEILKRLPEDEKPRLDELLFKGDGDGMKGFLSKHVGDSDKFVLDVVRTEMQEMMRSLEENRKKPS